VAAELDARERATLQAVDAVVVTSAAAARQLASPVSVTEPDSVALDGTLFVRVATSPWMNELQQKHGYPKLTKELKAKIFGFNAAKIYGVDVPAQRKRAANDDLARQKQAYLEERDPSFVTYGPKTRREFFALRREQGSRP